MEEGKERKSKKNLPPRTASAITAKSGLVLRIGIRASEHAAVEDDVVTGHKRGFAGTKPEDGFGDLHRLVAGHASGVILFDEDGDFRLEPM